jgi:hypothetical protein
MNEQWFRVRDLLKVWLIYPRKLTSPRQGDITVIYIHRFAYIKGTVGRDLKGPPHEIQRD